MGTRIQFTQLGPSVSFLPPMGLSSSILDQGCWPKTSLNRDYSSSCTLPVSHWGVCCSPGAKTIAKANGPQRTHVAQKTEVGKGFLSSLIRHRSRRGRNMGDSAHEKLKVRSLVDEATAHSSDLETSTSSGTTERNDAAPISKPSEFETQDDLVFARGQEMEAEDESDVDSSESSSSSGFDEGEEEIGEGIEILESPPNPIEMDYEDMKVGKLRNWSIQEMQKVDVLRNFEYRSGSEKGILVVQALRVEHMKAVEELLVDSFAELMGGLLTYRPLLTLTVRQYVRDRYACLPDAVTLVGLYAPAEENVAMGTREPENWLLAGTVELSFSDVGHPDIPAGPSPPPGSPYLCNMAVSSSYRRRGIGQQLLKAAEELAASQRCKDMYLHCRMVDMAPLNMYQGAGYQIVATDSIFSLLSFQRRRYLMKKTLDPPPSSPCE